MRFSSIKIIAAALLTLPLAACASSPGIVAANEPAHISSVKISMAQNVGSQRFADLLQARTTEHAARFGRAGAAKELRIVVERHSYKNPVKSLLIGDANAVGGRVAVIDVASGRIQGQVAAAAIDTAGVNGVIGAVVAAGQDKEKVDERLADGFAKASLRLALGSAIVDPVLYRDDPIIYSPPVRNVPIDPAENNEAAATPAAPAAPAPAPRKAREPKVSMAEPQALAGR